MCLVDLGRTLMTTLHVSSLVRSRKYRKRTPNHSGHQVIHSYQNKRTHHKSHRHGIAQNSDSGKRHEGLGGLSKSIYSLL